MYEFRRNIRKLILEIEPAYLGDLALTYLTSFQE